MDDGSGVWGRVCYIKARNRTHISFKKDCNQNLNAIFIFNQKGQLHGTTSCSLWVSSDVLASQIPRSESQPLRMATVRNSWGFLVEIGGHPSAPNSIRHHQTTQVLRTHPENVPRHEIRDAGVHPVPRPTIPLCKTLFWSWMHKGRNKFQFNSERLVRQFNSLLGWCP